MKYRPDIDGLRTVAVITIMFFHFQVPGFEGAFAGPEVFFVLSGYLIATRIFLKTEVGKFEFTDFYFKRIRRLFPAYAAMMLVTFVMAFIWMLPEDFRNFSKSFATSTVYLSNVQFYREAGYFDAASHLKPLLHTWSLSVEEQFYLFFPLVAVLLGRFTRQQLFFLFFIVSLLSFCAALYVIELDQSQVFYLFPYRIWELGLGIMLATGCYYLPKFKAQWGSELLAFVGLVLIIVPMLFYQPTMKFPGLAAVPACVGTWLIIQLDGARPTFVQRFLSLGPMTFIGKLSYSLYLWHWPIYVMYSYTDTDGVDGIELTGLIVLIFLVSYFFFKVVEEPTQKAKPFFVKTKRSVFISAGIASIVFIGLGLGVYKLNGLPDRFDAELQPAIAATHIFGDMSDCVEIEDSELENLGYCQIGDPLNAEKFTLVFGDSHSPTYRFALREKLPNANILIVWSGGCPAVFDVEVDERVATAETDALCLDRNRAVKNMVANDKRLDSVILLGRWSYYGHGKGVGVDVKNEIKLWPEGKRYNPEADQYEVYKTAFKNTVGFIRASGHEVFVIEQPPEFPQFNARTFVIDRIVGNNSVRKMELLTSISREELEYRQGPMMYLLEQMVGNGDIELLPTHKFFCNKDECSLVVNGDPIYFDNNHLSSLMVPKISDLFTPLVEHFEPEG